MEKFIPYEKLSKKQKRALDAARRGSWGALRPVTRRPEKPGAYKRKKARLGDEEFPDRAFFVANRTFWDAPLPAGEEARNWLLCGGESRGMIQEEKTCGLGIGRSADRLKERGR